MNRPPYWLNEFSKDLETSFLPPITQESNSQVDKNKKNSWHWMQVTAACFIKIVLSLIAASLVWKCNSKENII